MKHTLNSIFKEAKENYDIICKTHKLLESSYELKIPIHSAGQWILDNMYIIEEQYEEIRECSKSLKTKRLPVIKTHEGDKYISIFYLAYELVEENTGYIDQNLILNCLKEHQKLSYLSSEELDLFILMLKIALLKFIARICLNISNSQTKKIDVEEIISVENVNDKYNKEIFSNLKKSVNFKDYIINENHIKTANTAFIEYMSYRLKEIGQKGEKYFEKLNDEAEKIGFTVEEAIIKEHMEIAKTTDYIGRAILAYKQIQGINFREIFEKVNKIDEALKDDYTNEFKRCDYKTKTRYRAYIIKLAKKYNLSEVYVAKKAVECSKKYKKHVGFFLIGEFKYLLKKELKKTYFGEIIYNKFVVPTKIFWYLLIITLLAAEFTVLVGFNLFNFSNPLYIIIAFVILFILSFEVSQKIVNYFFRKALKPEILPRYDFAKTVDENNITYVVMPTIISSIEKLDQLIKKMEVTYLANRSDNMYYVLLGDCVSSDKQVIDMDKKIIVYAKQKLDELNSKYKSPHPLFNFIYRNRVYSKAEGCYMGWERKRGALLEFNKLVLGKLSEEEINHKFYITYNDIVHAKYAITIDEDTTLSLNTAKDLVSIVAHPLNKPILSKNGKIVKKGYGLIQPSVGLDIEDANKSIFSKIFGGFGGLDIYTTAVSDVYQDVFGEAIFCGKGIYNIELYDKLVAIEIPENLVLSHDLLEGSILRAALASDIEVQDGFPKNYIAYMKRSHRWYRGDMQIIRWLLSPMSKLNALSKWKIFDNLRRPMLDVISLIAIILSCFISTKTFAITCLLVFVAINFGNIISIFDVLLFGKIRHSKEVQYIPIIHGIDADFLTMCFNFVTLPYKSYICLNAFIKSLFRMIISHKHLLEWTTGEVLEKTAKDTLKYYIFNMLPNIIVGLFISFTPFVKFGSGLDLYFDFKIFIGLSMIVAPTFAYLLGKDHLFGRRKRLDKNAEEEVIDVAKRTWLFFDTMMSEVNNYLPTDNFQENRRYKIANRTSSTNIGFAILAIIDAYDLEFISFDECIDKLSKVMNTIQKLEKWNGHLYNWYNIKTLEPLRPRFISTVDSGNFVASLYVLKQFLNELLGKTKFEKEIKIKNENLVYELIDIVEQLIKDTDFTVLYDTSRNLFSIGYAQESGKLIDSYYDMLMSESRTTSLIAIASRQVTSKHWFALARNLVKVDGYKGLISWSGTSFEYFMPYLFNKSYEHTLIDQSLFFTLYSQIKYAKQNNVPWGISESAFAVKDEMLNYQYKEFGIPWLGLKRGLNNYLVVSPYSCLLMIEYSPIRVYKNIKKLKKLGMYSSYGFYESIDYTKEHLDDTKQYEIVKTYMAHHQGMILTAINNYINKGIIQRRFHRNPDIRACEILLKERERMKAKIKKKVSDNSNKFKPKEVNKYTTHVDCIYSERKYVEENPDFKQDLKVAFLRGGNMSELITNTGSSYIKYQDKIINKQRYTDIEGTGNFVYLTDKVTKNRFSLTDGNILSQNNKNTTKCVWTSGLNRVENYLEDGNLEITTTSFISPEYNVEIKKVSIYNNSNLRREMLVNTYMEPALTDYMTNVVHPSFSNLQIETYYDDELDILVASKRKKSETDTDIYLYSKLIGIDLDKEVETDKQKIVRNTDYAYTGNVTRYPLWPILSYRATIILDPYERQEFYYIVGVADSKYKISNTVVNLDENSIDDEYKLCSELNSIQARYLKLEGGKAAVYNNILKDVLFKNYNINNNKFWNETLNQSLLWKYSISGDLPIILVYVNKIENAGIINEVINFMDYVKNRKIDLDIVILIDEAERQNGPIYTYLKTRLDRAVYSDVTKGNIYLLNLNVLNKNEIDLLSFLAKRYIKDVKEFLTVSEEEDTAEELVEKDFENDHREDAN